MISKTLVTSASILAQLDALDAQSIAGQMRPQAVIIQEALEHPQIRSLLLSIAIVFSLNPNNLLEAELGARQSYFGLGIQIGICLAEARQMEELLSPCQP